MAITAISFSAKSLQVIDKYDLLDHTFWNEADGMPDVRSEIRDHYLPLQGYHCAYCLNQNIESHGMVWDCEHLLPKKIYPKFMFEPKNLVISCKSCNQAKEKYKTQLLCKDKAEPTTYPDGAEHYRLMHPIFESFSDYFQIKSVNNSKVIEILDSITEDKNEKAKFTYKCCNFKRFTERYAGFDYLREDMLYTAQKMMKSGEVKSLEDLIDKLEDPKTVVYRKVD